MVKINNFVVFQFKLFWHYVLEILFSAYILVKFKCIYVFSIQLIIFSI